MEGVHVEAQTVLVAGATGYMGRYLVRELHQRGYRVRALVRSRDRAEGSGAFGAPSLSGLVDEWGDRRHRRSQYDSRSVSRCAPGWFQRWV